MTIWSRLEKVSLLRSFGSFHSVQACSRVFQTPSYYSSGPPRQWGERCSGRFLDRLLSEVFTWRRRLPSWSDEKDGLASPLHQPTVHSSLLRGWGLPEAPSGLVALVVSDVCRGKGSFLGHCYWLEVLSSLVPVHGISHSKMGSYQAAIILRQGHDVI
jgi:hypothetical protein